MKKITLNELIPIISYTLDCTYKEGRKFYRDMIDCIGNVLQKKETVGITNFGKFKVFHKKERIGRNPKTGESHIISERYVVKFIPSRSLKEEIRDI